MHRSRDAVFPSGSVACIVPFMTNGGWPGHVIKDMKAACKGANVVCDMQIQFDSTGGSNLETPQEQINEWIQSVKNLL